ncbi:MULTISPECIES: Holliday junction resolvase [Methanoculleus]|uniref:Holliday junction resolvase (Hjc) n=1 Tax=Methanoculleus thermophilus TaxID=2200 RepID=A0A1G8XR57_9EURY|nr:MULTISPECIES: Holliday junction resolvase [Methanoculleus]NLN09192.1 Holliday junction resolvase [Methanoculleus thermophilus]SDJ93061.1 holliday junction resolvase (hjc) [Methanoculleus thermophilus]HQD25983.1 Holliday junction resolvase [Methanoculleus thermophilus]
MANFELEVASCINRFFAQRKMQGFAYRLKQSKFNTQYVDVLVDSLDPRYYLAIECKSISGKKLYFSKHFHLDKNNVHQVDSITDFIRKTGRRGFLAVEFRFGAGIPKEAYLMPWEQVLERYRTAPGISIEDFRLCCALTRSNGEYELGADTNQYPLSPPTDGEA